MWVSLQVLLAATLVLSLLLYLVEHNAQPDVFRNYWDALLWSFMGYFDDPGEFATYTPITFWGRILKITCAIVNIAIFAVPAGLVAGGFSDAMAEDKRRHELADYRERLLKAFRRKQDRLTKFRVVPRYVSPVDIQAMQQIDTKDIIDGVRSSESMFRLRNLATAIPTDRHPQDRLVIETVPCEGRTEYGCMIDRGSPITIVAPTAANEVAIGHFAYYLALYGGFNYVSKERDEDPDNPRSYYLLSDDLTDTEQKYVSNLAELSQRPDSWLIFVIAADSVHPENLHFVTAIQSKLNAGESTVTDRERFHELYERIADDMDNDFGLKSECDLRYLPAGKKNVAFRMGSGSDRNAFTLRLDWAVAAFDDREIAIARRLATDIASVLLPGRPAEDVDPSWKSTGFGY